MEKIRILALLLVLSFVICVVTPSVSQALSLDALVADVKNKLGVNEKIAKAFLQYVLYFVSETQKNFTLIASHKTSPERKRALIVQTLENYFEDPMNSEVQVPSLKRKQVKTYAVQVYLNRLSKLKYDTIKLYYNPNYFSMGPIEAYTDPYTGKKGFNFNVQVWQMFEGCRGDGNRNICYKDFTKEGFHIVFMRAKSGWVMRIHGITADKTVSLEFDTGQIWD